MTPTEELRAKLDELGIEWKSEINCDTYWYGQDRTFYKFTEYSDGTTSFSTCQWNLTPKQVLTTPIAATVGKDIEHYDGSGRRGTVAILQGGRKPEEVMFVGEDGGVTHYLPENAGTCEWCKDGKTFDKQTVMVTNHGWQEIRHCPNCGRRLASE